jgi:hypothetical protein
MRIRTLVLVTALTCVSTGAGAAAAPAPKEESAAATCESGRPSRAYPEPADACWRAFSDAIDKREFIESVAYARRGCGQYKRGDFCAFINHFEDAHADATLVRRATENERVVRALAYAAEFIWPVDVEDAERGASMRRHAQAVRSGRR